MLVLTDESRQLRSLGMTVKRKLVLGRWYVGVQTAYETREAVTEWCGSYTRGTTRLTFVGLGRQAWAKSARP